MTDLTPLTFDHAPDPDEVLVAIRHIVADHGKPLSNPIDRAWLDRENTRAQTTVLLVQMLAAHETRLADFLHAYLAADRLECTGPSDDLREHAETMLDAAETLAREFEGAADYLEDVQ
jgi:hypothetical protein